MFPSSYSKQNKNQRNDTYATYATHDTSKPSTRSFERKAQSGKERQYKNTYKQLNIAAGFANDKINELNGNGFIKLPGDTQTIIIADILDDLKTTSFPYQKKIDEWNVRINEFEEKLDKADLSEKNEISNDIKLYQKKITEMNSSSISPIIEKGRWLFRYLVGMHIYSPIGCIFKYKWPLNLISSKEKKFCNELKDGETVKLYKAAKTVYEFFKQGGEIGNFSFPGYALFPIASNTKPEMENMRKIMFENGYVYSMENMITTIDTLQHYGYHCMWEYTSRNIKTKELLQETLFDMASVSFQQKFINDSVYRSIINKLINPSEIIMNQIVNSMMSKITTVNAQLFGTHIAFIALQPKGSEMIVNKLLAHCTSLASTVIDPKTCRIEIAAGYMRNIKSAIEKGPVMTSGTLAKTFFAKNSYNADTVWTNISLIILKQAKNYDKFNNKAAAGALIGEAACSDQKEFINWTEKFIAAIDMNTLDKHLPVVLSAIVHSKIYNDEILHNLTSIMEKSKGKIKFDIKNCIEQFKTFNIVSTSDNKEDSKQIEIKQDVKINELSEEDISFINIKDLVKKSTKQQVKKSHKKEPKKEIKKKPIHNNCNVFTLLVLEDDE
jgi:hypothetical protein